MPPYSGTPGKNVSLHIHKYVLEKEVDYKTFKSIYEILRVRVNGKDKIIEEKSGKVSGRFNVRQDENEVEIYLRNQQTGEIIRIHVPLYIKTVE